MKCPHCLENFHSNKSDQFLDSDIHGTWRALFERCPACKRIIIELKRESIKFGDAVFLSYPRGIARSPLPPEVDDVQVIEDYNEGSLVLGDSPKASAAISRRCLQHILREKAGIKKSNLDNEIQQVLDKNILPSDIAQNLDVIRNIGNFGAHPIKSTSTGEIVSVEPNEAEWNLEVLEQLIDFYYIRPALAKKKRDELNVKLTSVGKAPLK